MTLKKKKKVDYEALNSAFMRIPGMDVLAARALLDLGLKETYELVGRAPDALYDAYKKHHNDAPTQILWSLRMAVYVAETPEPDPKRLKPALWS
jgi:hypothetical protein